MEFHVAPKSVRMLKCAKLTRNWLLRALRVMPAPFQRVRPEGFEPPTLGSEDRCSIQLSYGRKAIINKPYMAIYASD